VSTPDEEQDARGRAVIRGALQWLRSPEGKQATVKWLKSTQGRSWLLFFYRLAVWLEHSPDGKLFAAWGDYNRATAEHGRLASARTVAQLLRRHARGVARRLVAAEVAETTEAALVHKLLDREGQKLDKRGVTFGESLPEKGLFLPVAFRNLFTPGASPKGQRGAVGYLGSVFRNELSNWLEPLQRPRYASARGAELADFPDGAAAVIAPPEPAPEAEELRAIQARLGLLQRGFARALGKSHTLLSLVYSGRKRPSSALVKAARALLERHQ